MWSCGRASGPCFASAEHAGRLVGKDDIIAKRPGRRCGDRGFSHAMYRRDTQGHRRRGAARTAHGATQGLHAGSVAAPMELAGRAPDLPSLAVMPFLSVGEDLGEDRGPLTLGCGVASEIINELARNRHLRLIGRDFSFALANQNLLAQELGEQLGARYLVEGTAQRLDGTLVVDVQLVDARDGSIAWGDRFSATAPSVPQVQHEIASRIAGSLHSGIREVEKHAISGRLLATSTSTS